MIRKLVPAAILALLAWTLSVPVHAYDDARLVAAFKKADKDNDGTLNREEAKAMPRVLKNFDSIDTDKDGLVSLDDIRATLKKAGK